MLISLMLNQRCRKCYTTRQTHVGCANILTKLEFSNGCVKKYYLESV